MRDTRHHNDKMITMNHEIPDKIIDDNEHDNSSTISMREIVETEFLIKPASHHLNEHCMNFSKTCLGQGLNSNEIHGRISQERRSVRKSSQRYDRRGKKNTILEFLTQALTPFAYWSMGKCPPLLCHGNSGKVDHMSTNSQEQGQKESNNNSNLVCTINNDERFFMAPDPLLGIENPKHYADDDDYIYTPVGSIMTNTNKGRMTPELQNDAPLPDNNHIRRYICCSY